MKKIFLYTLLFLSLIVNSQTLIPIEEKFNNQYNSSINNFYFKDINNVYDKFIGIWKYETATDLLEIELYLVENVSFSNFNRDELRTKIKYIKNGMLIFDTFSDITKHIYVSGGFFPNPTETDKINMSYTEPDEAHLIDKRRYERLKLNYINDLGVEKLEWKLWWQPLQDSCPLPKIPTDIILIKQ
ncbi:hypothetical protein M9Q43_13295 [Flavobacterium sp. HXWNR29]|uniref:DUF6705 family protein n=1 Tax=Flavobacterium odoriferum TaxID=2946604 RepID=UPI0021CB3853|nr:DUF6705 family protein [Flavobacterium sp. HXWNR29]MCU4190132.1 hypothetical protein [Flavobacterium sp. HXWNR29]